MQLILSIDVESGIKKNMSATEETILKNEKLQSITDELSNEASKEIIDKNNILTNFNVMESDNACVEKLARSLEDAKESKNFAIDQENSEEHDIEIKETATVKNRSNENELNEVCTGDENTKLQGYDGDCNETEMCGSPIHENSDISNKSSETQDEDNLVDFDIDLVQNISPVNSVLSLGSPSPSKDNEDEDKNCIENISTENLVHNLENKEENNEIHKFEGTNVVPNITDANSAPNDIERENTNNSNPASDYNLYTISKEDDTNCESVINLDSVQPPEDAQESNEFTQHQELSESNPVGTHSCIDSITVENSDTNVIKENKVCIDSNQKIIDENVTKENENSDTATDNKNGSETDIEEVNTCDNLTIDTSLDNVVMNLKSQAITGDNQIKTNNEKEPEDKEKVLTNIEHKQEQKTKLNLISKLSNTLDILSDDEDESTSKPESPKPESELLNKQCINIEDDDDIMLIDDECVTKENSIETDNDTHGCSSEIMEYTDSTHNKEIAQESTGNTYKDGTDNDLGSTLLEPEIKAQEKQDFKESKQTIVERKSPLLSPDFLKTFKKSLAEATREDLEEFCILKIVESVFNKSNLGEIKSQLKVMSQTVEEYKNKAKMLTKQNRDLQVVLKSVQEELKKNSGVPITPLKITRSVGMQVLMTDKNSRKRLSLPTSQTVQNPNLANQTGNTTNNKNQSKAPHTRPLKAQQQIPVPRLVPAVNNGPKSISNAQPQTQNNSAKLPPVNNTPNGVKIGPPGKPEKRTHSKMQQNNSITVDLTDDEPPSKVVNRNFNTPVRCVPPQNLLAPQRPPHTQPLNSPRKVYIPISGPQGQNIKPGQTIMLKSLPPGPRQRGPSPNLKLPPSSNPVRMNRTPLRHPAPLPDSMKQYQPPNWKAIPPAPELKLAKVENGIVISWKIDEYRDDCYEEIASYQLYAYQETSSPPNTSLWKKIGDVKALPLPMACTLTQFMAGYKYYFAVRAIDVKSRFGPFSLPGSILLLNKI